ncbi:Protease [Saliniradius amylolyticus]|uniref:Protease n=1 Tax=Saliniradius amylolyticus TaxID=2183582 RepID=A0A2S2E2I2_9ALTE|nr:signal peptide peptidase SppA [Saliniradius amylolyticus]AWL11799.1 Protease [Saliniradius amylolyticus]
MASGKSFTKSLFTGLWAVLNFSRKLFFNLIFIAIAVGIIVAIVNSEDGKVVVPKDSALVLNLNGKLVVQETQVDPFEKFMQEALGEKEEDPEVLVRDVIFAIDNAKQDNRIKTLILDLHGLRRSGLDKLGRVAEAIDSFKESGKSVYAIGDYFSQSQYYIASHADNLYLNPMGGLMFDGYGRYKLYYRSALEKLKVNPHIFRVGTYKSAVEPFMRDDMSDEAKEANLAWLNALWDQYKTDVASARGLEASHFDDDLDKLNQKLSSVDGDFAQYALEYQWVDALKTREEVRTEMVDLVGKDDSRLGFRHISYDNYLKVIKLPFIGKDNGTDNVGVVVAKGTILNGNQPAGTIGGDSTARLLRQARMDDDIKAVVLQVDSPGGSAFASELIRQEVEQLKAAGKPVVVSMSTYAASGGYWISTSADQIWANPSTITGSIGVFGLFMTFEDSLDYLGINADGVGTTDLAGLSPFNGLKPKAGELIQKSIEHTYDQFISLVATHRDMTKSEVDEIAQGRVWVGSKAKELGLVDELGDVDDAVRAAAELAELDKYDTHYVEPPLSPQEKFWRELFGTASVWMGDMLISQSDSTLIKMARKTLSEFDQFAKLNDPKGTYALCFYCQP